MLARLRRHLFPALSLALHAALLGVLYAMDVRVELDRQRIQRTREQPLIEAGARLTERARLEQRVHDMARIASVLERGAAAHDDDVQFSARPRTPQELLEEADSLSRRIDAIERDARADRLWVGAHDDAQLWLNDRLVWRGRSVAKARFYREVGDPDNTHARDYNFSEGKRVVHFRQGRNKLFFKLSNGMGALFFSLVLTQ